MVTTNGGVLILALLFLGVALVVAFLASKYTPIVASDRGKFSWRIFWIIVLAMILGATFYHYAGHVIVPLLQELRTWASKPLVLMDQVPAPAGAQLVQPAAGPAVQVIVPAPPAAVTYGAPDAKSITLTKDSITVNAAPPAGRLWTVIVDFGTVKSNRLSLGALKVGDTQVVSGLPPAQGAILWTTDLAGKNPSPSTPIPVTK